MKTSLPSRGLFSIANALPAVFVLGLVSWTMSHTGALAATYDFDAGNDTGLYRYDPIHLALGGGQYGIWSFPNGHYRIQANQSPNSSALGPGRAGSLAQDTIYTSFYSAVDIMGWNDSLNQAFGILARVQPNPSPGTTAAYSLTYQTHYHTIQLSYVLGENPNEIAPTSTSVASIQLYPTNAYRLIFQGSGTSLQGRLYLLSDLTTPLATVTANHSTLSSGTIGLVVFDNSGGTGTADATFDNFTVASDEQPKLSITLFSPVEVMVRWPSKSTGFALQWTDVIAPSATWNDALGDIILDGDHFYYIDDSYSGNRFYRLVKP